MFSKLAKFGIGLALAFTAQTAKADIILGGYVTVANTGDVIATYLGHTAGYTNLLYLYLPTNSNGVIFNNHTTPVGTTVNLGSFAAGTELQFQIHVNNTGDNFYSGPGWRNADGLPHAIVDNETYAPNVFVGFEDLMGGGDRDYDDVKFMFSNVAAVTTLPSVPEPTTVGLFAIGALGLGLVSRRKNKA